MKFTGRTNMNQKTVNERERLWRFEGVTSCHALNNGAFDGA